MTPRSPTGRRGGTLFSHWKKRRRLVALFPREKMRRRLVPMRGDIDFDGTA
ncbi:hypothetical protein GW17_00009974, partial [Ensete ventricosum]